MNSSILSGYRRTIISSSLLFFLINSSILSGQEQTKAKNIFSLSLEELMNVEIITASTEKKSKRNFENSCKFRNYFNNYPDIKINILVEAVDRTEIARGPMSVIYGSGIFMSAINIITNNADNTYNDNSIISLLTGSMNIRNLSLA